MRKLSQILLIIIFIWPFAAYTQCPRYTGVYNRRDGIVKDLMAFNITSEGKLYLVTRDTGMDGVLLEIDGVERSQILQNGSMLKYVAGCERGYLIVQGSLNDEEFSMTISDEDGGRIVSARADSGQAVYERAMRGSLR